MANRRNLKKDINFLTSEMLMECDVKIFLKEGASKEKIIAIGEELIAAKQEALSKLTQPEFVQGGSKPGKKYCKEVVVEFVEKSNGLLDQLSKL